MVLGSLATSPAWSLPNTDNEMGDPAACQGLKSDLHNDTIHNIAFFGLLKAAEDRGDVEEIWRLKRKFYSASVRVDIQEVKFYRTCSEAPFQ